MEKEVMDTEYISRLPLPLQFDVMQLYNQVVMTYKGETWIFENVPEERVEQVDRRRVEDGDLPARLLEPTEQLDEGVGRHLLSCGGGKGLGGVEEGGRRVPVEDDA